MSELLTKNLIKLFQNQEEKETLSPRVSNTNWGGVKFRKTQSKRRLKKSKVNNFKNGCAMILKDNEKVLRTANRTVWDTRD